jgi:hypothetical protein
MRSQKLFDRGGHRMEDGAPAILRTVHFGDFEIIGPGYGSHVHTVDFYVLDQLGRPSKPYAILRDTDLVVLFDKQMDIYAWLDLAAERHPKIQKFADALGGLLSGAAK